MYGISVARVPAYSPYAVAEHAIALLMSVNRRIPAASVRVKMSNFTLESSLLGMDIHGKSVGVMGTGKIGQILCRIIKGFGASLLAYDVFESAEVKDMGGKYVSKEEIYKNCDVIFLMMPLLPSTTHIINASVLPLLKKGVILINTSRGGLVDTSALVSGLQSGIIGGCGLDVYENEGDYFFQDWSGKPVVVSIGICFYDISCHLSCRHPMTFWSSSTTCSSSASSKNLTMPHIACVPSAGQHPCFPSR
jgi:D-lactate dehydrogenase